MTVTKVRKRAAAGLLTAALLVPAGAATAMGETASASSRAVASTSAVPPATGGGAGAPSFGAARTGLAGQMTTFYAGPKDRQRTNNGKVTVHHPSVFYDKKVINVHKQHRNNRWRSGGSVGSIVHYGGYYLAPWDCIRAGERIVKKRAKANGYTCIPWAGWHLVWYS